MSVFLAAFGLTFLAELPDKTALATVMLAARRSHRAVLAGACAALTLQAALAAVLGAALARLPRTPVRLAAAALFVFVAVKLWREEDAPAGVADRGAGGRFWPDARTAFAVIFLAELGDMTQLSTASLAASSGRPLPVFLGAVLGLCSVSALAVALGARLGSALNPRLLRRSAAVVFALVASALIFA